MIQGITKGVQFYLREWFRGFAGWYLILIPFIAIAMVGHVPHQVIGCTLILHGLLFAPTFIPNASVYGPVMRRFKAEKKEVFLTLDDGPDPVATPRVLELMAAHQAKGCFFVVGEKARKFPALVRDIAAQGHELANHTESHRERHFWVLGWGGVSREVDACSEAIASAASAPVRWFRAPVGFTNPFVHSVVQKRNLRVLGWSAWARDTGKADCDEAVQRVLRAVRPGAVIVLHPEWRAPDGSYPALECFEKVLVELEAMGYRYALPPTGAFAA
jgi:peptidoglycan/xylan/chitin deacetylase (PgdA/CDA1 family)